MPVTVNVAVAVARLPDSSVTKIEIARGPSPTLVPASGDCVITSAVEAEQLSVATTDGTKFGTTAVQLTAAAAVALAV